MDEYVRPVDLPRFERPPVVLVTMDMVFEPLEVRTIDLHELINRWLPEFPHLEELRPTPSRFETSPSRLRIEVADAPAMPRLRFDDDRSVLGIDIQSDRLRLTWRRRAEHEYPSYVALREKFVRLSLDLADFKGDNIQVVDLGIRYSNEFRLEDSDPLVALSRANCLSDSTEPGRDDLNTANLDLRHSFLDSDGHRYAGLYVRSSVTRADDGSRHRMSLRYSGDPFAAPGAENLDGFGSILRFFDVGHDTIVRTFADRTSAELHDEWGRYV